MNAKLRKEALGVLKEMIISMMLWPFLLVLRKLGWYKPKKKPGEEEKEKDED